MLSRNVLGGQFVGDMTRVGQVPGGSLLVVHGYIPSRKFRKGPTPIHEHLRCWFSVGVVAGLLSL